MDHLRRNPPSGVLMETAALSLSFDLERTADDNDDDAAAVATRMTTCFFFVMQRFIVLFTRSANAAQAPHVNDVARGPVSRSPHP